MSRNAFLALALAGAVALAAPGEETPSAVVEKFASGEGAPVLVIGDSMMRLLGQELEKEFKNAYVQPVKAYSSLGSGLARIDAMDWFAKAQSLMDEVHPKVAIVCIGANDKQTMKDANGDNLVYGTKEWTAEYSARLSRLMTILETGGKGADGKDKGGAKTVIWLLLPDMREAPMQEFAMDLNAIILKVAGSAEHKKAVVVTDMRQMLERRPGHFTPYMTDHTGATLKVRDADGVHLTQPGARVVAQALVKTYWK